MVGVNVKNLEDNKEDISLLYQKLGCFKDDATHPDLKTKVNIKKATQDECVKACALEDKSFSYFGLQDGSSCYCGKDYGKYGKLSDDACSAKCEGNKEESCGGQQANNIFFFGLGKQSNLSLLFTSFTEVHYSSKKFFMVT